MRTIHNAVVNWRGSRYREGENFSPERRAGSQVSEPDGARGRLSPRCVARRRYRSVSRSSSSTTTLCAYTKLVTNCSGGAVFHVNVRASNKMPHAAGSSRSSPRPAAWPRACRRASPRRSVEPATPSPDRARLRPAAGTGSPPDGKLGRLCGGERGSGSRPVPGTSGAPRDDFLADILRLWSACRRRGCGIHDERVVKYA